MGFYKYLRETWKQPKKNIGSEAWKEKLVELRKQPAILRVEKPTRIDKARAVGYKAKQGIFVVRSRVTRGQRKVPRITGGRRPKRWQHFKTAGKSSQTRAEEHVDRKYPNAEVLNSYWVAKDGQHQWYEVVMVDRDHPAIKKDKRYAWVAKGKGRVFRGKTASGRKGRGLQR